MIEALYAAGAIASLLSFAVTVLSMVVKNSATRIQYLETLVDKLRDDLSRSRPAFKEEG